VVVVVGGGGVVGVVVVVDVVVVVAPAAFFSSLVVSKNPQIDCVSRFIETLGAKNTVNIDVFCASEAQKHRYLLQYVFCPW
jgi:hypothetical protein